ncbi:cellulose synthase subunit BcsC-related outer membrane protein [Photobacterium damselae]|uniref:cellulose synthase subunit BcsC-related outer membrane protein n=1 Tax=Photobacterium damselae TaxID=38293 RepID=UPI0025439154
MRLNPLSFSIMVSSLLHSTASFSSVSQPLLLTNQVYIDAYQSIYPKQFLTDLSRVNSVNLLLNQLKLADAIGREDIITSTLERLFAIKSNNLDGQYYQAKLYIKQNQLELADRILVKMKHEAPDSRQVGELSVILSLKEKLKSEYQLARLLGKSGRYQDAINKYKVMFPQGMPTPQLTLEFLLLEGNIQSLYGTVKKGLEQLNIEYPGVPEYQLALADHIRKREPGNPWVLETYRRLALIPSLGTAAATSWLRALDELPISKKVEQQYAILASYYPADLEIQRANQGAIDRWHQEQELRKDPSYLAKLKGLELLDNNKNAQAKRQLLYAYSTRPTDPQILGGLGKVYLRMGRQSKALHYFELAKQFDEDPDSISKWEALIRTSRYWAYLDKGDHAVTKQQWLYAKHWYLKALSIDDSEPYALCSLGDLWYLQHEYFNAFKYYRKAMIVDATNSAALKGMLKVKIATDDLSAALAFAKQFSHAQQKAISEYINQIELGKIQQDLHIALEQNDKNQIQKALDKLILRQPRSPWIRYDIAKTMLFLGDKERADELMRQWAKQNADPEMKFAYALYLSKDGLLGDAITTLESIPVVKQTMAMKRNLDRMKLTQALDHIVSLYAKNPTKATHKLALLEISYRENKTDLIRIANAWIDINNIHQAIDIYQKISSKCLRADDQISFAKLMLRLHRFSDFDRWSQSFENNQVMTQMVLVNFTQLKYQRIFDQAQFEFAHHDFSHASVLYKKLISSPEPYQTQAQIGLLKSLIAIDDHVSIKNLVLALDNKRSILTDKQLVEVSMLFSQLGYQMKSAELNQLVGRNLSADAQDYRNSLSIAMRNNNWSLAEHRAYQALLSSRNERHGKKTAPVTLHQLYDTADDYWLTQGVKSDIDELHARSDGHVIIGYDSSGRDGKNTATQIPIEAKIPVEKWNGHWLLRADYVSVDSGKLAYFGSGSSKDEKKISFYNHTHGIALGLGWLAHDWKVDIGSTPIGFEQTHLVGGVSFQGDFDEFAWHATLSRRPETSSTLSYAGMNVPSQVSTSSGRYWGGVLKTGIKLNTSWDVGGTYGFWSSVQYHVLTGDNVASNTRLGLLGGMYAKLLSTEDQRLSIGTNMMYLHYDKNLDEYQFGSGGYYSPQAYFSLSLPVNFYGRYGNSWSYFFSGSISHSWSREDAPYGNVKGSASETSHGVGYSLQGSIEKRVSKHWYLGASLDLQRAKFYTPNHFLLYAKYTFADRWQPIEIPVSAPMLYGDFD